MCGIIAAIAERNVVPILIEGLTKLEYRGYDSAGLAVINKEILLHKTINKVKDLNRIVIKHRTCGNVGIAHTRWATHGKPKLINAHPIIVKNIAIVHNGVIENYEELKKSFKTKHKFKFESETDSEIIAAKIYFYCKRGIDLLSAVIKTCNKLEGSYSIAAMDLNNPDSIVAAKKNSPLVLGVGVKEYFVASDSLALQNLTQNLIYLKDGDVAKISICSKQGIEIYDLEYNKVKRAKTPIKVDQYVVDKGKYRHFMQKEIFEQPISIQSTIKDRIIQGKIINNLLGKNTSKVINRCKNIQIVACGTSYHAGLIAKYWFEEFVGLPCQVDIASEFRYRNKVIMEDSLFITISQSGETADAIAALKNLIELEAASSKKSCGFLTISNVSESSLVRLSNLVALAYAGVEVGVASTKAFTSQLAVLLILLAKFLEKYKVREDLLITKELVYLPKNIEKFLQLADRIKLIAKKFEHKTSTLFMARGLLFPIALEGALKLKELSYIHAEAFPGGELKHGPLALVDHEMPVIVLMANDTIAEKLKANIQEVLSRGGEVIVFADQDIVWPAKLDPQLYIIKLPRVPYWLAPLVYAIPMQLLAYYVAVLKGTDVDQPRNLAKSVTVE